MTVVRLRPNINCNKPHWDGMGGFDPCGHCAACIAPERRKAISIMVGSAKATNPNLDEWGARLAAAKHYDGDL
jgi:hypothetical protein